MDDLEKANQRILERRKDLKANTPTRLTRLSIPTPDELRTAYKTHMFNCRKCDATSESVLCRACSEEIERLRWQVLRDTKKNNFAAYIEACGVPKLFRNTKETSDDRSLFITGDCGVGKTYVAASTLRGFVKNLSCDNFITPFRNTPIFVNVPDLLIKIRACFDSDSKTSEEEMLQKYFDTKLLILDDLGAEKTTDWALQSLYVIINKRGSEERQTIITSNLTLNEIKDKLSDRIASRINGMCKIIEIKGKDRRLK